MRRCTRRGLLAGALPVVAGTAGCLDSTTSDDGAGDGTGSRTTTTHAETSEAGGDAGSATRHDVDGRRVRLLSTWTGRAIVTLLAGAHPSVSADRDRQYVVVELAVSGGDAQSAAADACVLEIDDATVEPVPESVRPFTDGVHLAFALPLDVDPETVTLAWVGAAETVRFPLSDAVASSLRSPPAFEGRSFDVPATADGDAVEVSFTVANVGEGDGEFLAELGTRALSDQSEVRVPVDAGETETVTRTVGLVPSAGEQRVVLDWGWNSLERTVAVPTTTE
jgi:hypothetical protein